MPQGRPYVPARFFSQSLRSTCNGSLVAARDAGTDLGEQLVAEGLLTREEVAAAADPVRALGMATAFVDRVTGK